MHPLVYAILAFAGVALLVAAVWFAGIVLEFEYPHVFEIRRARRAVGLDGRPALAGIAGVLGTGEDRLHVHVCSYCRDWLSGVPGAVYVQVSRRDAEAPVRYGFAYHRGTRQLAPADGEGRRTFGRLVPAGTRLAPVTQPGVVEPHSLAVPDRWLPSP